jgi:hypothetical protein
MVGEHTAHVIVEGSAEGAAGGAGDARLFHWKLLFLKRAKGGARKLIDPPYADRRAARAFIYFFSRSSRPDNDEPWTR